MTITELTIEECRKFLVKTRLGRLACARDNQPYAVPVDFVYDTRDYLYAFSTLGQKIEWMRANPLVCVEFDSIKQQNDWITVVVFGQYEELPPTQQFASERIYAYELLSRQPSWWQPAYVGGDQRPPSENAEPIYFRIHISQMTGHRASVDEAESDGETGQITQQRAWWKKLFGW
jgi:uncharacterized protein